MAKGGMGNIMKQAQMMQANLQKAQAEHANIDVEGSAGNGMIKITISCKHEIKKVDKTNNNLDDGQEKEESKAPETEPPSKPFSMGLGIGSATLDGVLYNQLALRPEINIGKIGIGFDLVVYLDNEGNVRNEEWDIESDPGLLFDKILYIKYGR